MAESDSLDDFFAKKDKKKKKSKSSKIVTSDLLPQPTSTPPNEPSDYSDQLADQVADVKIDNSSELDANTKEKKKTRKKKDKDDAKKEEDEWNLVSDEPDYSGLRIATTNTIQAKAEEEAEQGKPEPEYDEDGQIIDKSADGGVWKITPSEPAAEQAEQVAPAPTPVITQMPNVSTEGKYVPPSRRAGAATTSLAPVSLKKNPYKKKVAPNMNSQEDFPTLGAAPPPVDYDVSKFERVRGGGVVQQHSQGEQTRLQTSNMYSALERN